jgi:hypothetical protein
MFRARDALTVLDDDILLVKWYKFNGEFNVYKYNRFPLNSSIIDSCIASIVKKAVEKKFELKMPPAVQKYFLEYFNKMCQLKNSKTRNRNI